MLSELACIKDLLTDCREESNEGAIFYIGKRGNHTLILTQSGIGKVCSATRTLNMIYHYHPDCILNTGVAGGIDISTQVFDIVTGKEIVYHDVWCGEENEPGQRRLLPGTEPEVQPERNQQPAPLRITHCHPPFIYRNGSVPLPGILRKCLYPR